MNRDVSGQCRRSLLRSHHSLLQKVVALGKQAPVLVQKGLVIVLSLTFKECISLESTGGGWEALKVLECAISLKS